MVISTSFRQKMDSYCYILLDCIELPLRATKTASIVIYMQICTAAQNEAAYLVFGCGYIVYVEQPSAYCRVFFFFFFFFFCPRRCILSAYSKIILYRGVGIKCKQKTYLVLCYYFLSKFDSILFVMAPVTQNLNKTAVYDNLNRLAIYFMA